jgi:hypothetical protein
MRLPNDRGGPRAKSMRVRVAPLIWLFAIVVLFYWKFTLSGQYEWMWGPDAAQQVVPWFTVAARQWNSGTLPLWDPHMYGGQPLIGQAQPGVAYFLNWIFYSLPRKNDRFSGDMFNWYLVVVHYLAAVFTYYLCRSLRRSIPASIIAGLIFALTSYVGSTDWPQMINGAVWAPLVFLFLFRAIERLSYGSAALSGLCLGVAWLSGHHQIPLFMTLATFAAWAFFTIRDRSRARRVLSMAAVALCVMAMVGALQILPAREYGTQALRWVSAKDPVTWNQKVPYSVHEQFSMTPISVTGVVVPGVSTVSESFVGFIALGLAIAGVIWGWRDARVRVLAFVAIGGFLYAFGSYSLLEGVFYGLVPLVEKARTPGAAIILFGFATSVLAAFGADALPRRRLRPYARAYVIFCSVTGGLLLSLIFVLTVLNANANQRVALAGVYGLLCAVSFAAIRARVIRPRHAVILFGCLVLLEASSIMPYGVEKINERMAYLNRIRSNSDIARFLRTQPQQFRLMFEGDEIPGNWAAFNDLDALTGYLASITHNIAVIPMHVPNVQSLWGVRYWIGASPQSPEDRDIFTGQSGRKVYLRKTAFARAWALHRVDRAENRQKINEAIESDLSSFTGRALMLQEPPPLETCQGEDRVTSTRPAADTVIVTAELPCKGMVIVSDTYFPGWKADVDGQSAEIHEVNGAMRGVVVPAGRHTLTMLYRPASVYIGGALTVLGVLATCFAVWFERKHQPGQRTE